VIGRYAVLASRIRQDLVEIEKVVQRVERAMRSARHHTPDQDLFVDSAALNLHDFYAGLERIFEQIASSVDRTVPSAHDWHRELLRQMAVEVPGLRPHVISVETAGVVDEYRRFRHVVRNVYAFELDAERVEHLASALRPALEQVSRELLAFAALLADLAQEG
jgi:hypothetical protein